MDTSVACWVGHIVGPLWYLSEGYSISTNAINCYGDDEVRRVNMEKVEWLGRCGLYQHIPQFQSEVDFILDHIDSDGICKVDFYENEFRGWESICRSTVGA